jgi:hypothetical protein
MVHVMAGHLPFSCQDEKAKFPNEAWGLGGCGMVVFWWSGDEMRGSCRCRSFSKLETQSGIISILHEMMGQGEEVVMMLYRPERWIWYFKSCFLNLKTKKGNWITSMSMDNWKGIQFEVDFENVERR